MKPSLLSIRSVQEFNEVDKDQGVERSYMYYKNSSSHVDTQKQVVDLIESPVWGKMLFLDGTLQSTTADEVIYHNALVHPLMSVLQNKESILIIGGGEGATAREVLRWSSVKKVKMVEYDKELVDLMKTKGDAWSKGAFNDLRLSITYEDAWIYLQNNATYNGVIVDLTDPDLKKQDWLLLLRMVLESVKSTKGGFVMNAGLYFPWKTDELQHIVGIIQRLCMENNEFKYYMYTVFIPSFNGEWTFIVVSHKSSFMIEPEFLTIIPDWIRRGIKTLENKFISTKIDRFPNTFPIESTI